MTELVQNSKVVQRTTDFYSSIEDDYVFIKIFNNREISTKILEQIFELIPANSQSLLIDFSGLSYIDRKSKEILASSKVRKHMKACAILAPNIKARFLAHYFIEIYHPHIPIQHFEHKDPALEWLSSF